MNEAIRVENLTKFYREGFWSKKLVALQDLSFTVPEGSIFGFLGANGAGKTTCIKILVGLQFASSGRASLFGKACEQNSARSEVGYLPERPYFHDNLTAREFLDFHRNLHSLRKVKAQKTNEELLIAVGLKGIQDKLLRSFSKGMLQRIGIAQCLIHDPKLIILDEPMSGLDPIGRKDVRNLILDLSKEGKTIFFSTHILNDAESLCHEIAYLEKGSLRFTGSLEKLLVGNANEYEVIFSGLDSKQISESAALKSAQAFGESWKIGIRGEKESKEAVENIWRQGGTLKSFSRQHKTLEEVLFGKGTNL